VQVIDKGIEINIKRHHLLFKPFLELKQKQSFALVKDKSIGLGLSCSHSIVTKLVGSILLEVSKYHLTVFSFLMPIKTEMSSQKKFFKIRKAPIQTCKMIEKYDYELKNYLLSQNIHELELLYFKKYDDMVINK
jgi:hypothetical protein